MQYFTLEKLSYGGQVDMKVRPQIDAPTGGEIGRTHVITENPWSDHVTLPGGKNALYREAAEILLVWLDQ